MRLQWSEIRARAAEFAERHKPARYEKGETQTFYNDFFECFGVSRRQVATYEQRVRNLPGNKQGFIDLFWPGTLIVSRSRPVSISRRPALRHWTITTAEEHHLKPRRSS